MSKRMGVGLALVFAMATLQACGTDDGGSGTTTDTAVTDAGADSTGDTGAGDAAVDTADAATVTAGPKDQCQGTTDKTWLTTKQDGDKTGRDLASAAASKCGVGCLSNPDPKTCSVTCMVDQEKVKLSASCAGCYGDIVLCTIKGCASKCIADSSAKICTDCQQEKGCTDAFYACTGKLD